MIANSNTCGGCEVGGNNNTSSSVQHPLLATRLLRESLLVSLGRVLTHSDTGITLESACSLADLEDGSALIAGSSIVQTCLGELWGGDVDIYTSAKAAPNVRSVSTKHVCIFVYERFSLTAIFVLQSGWSRRRTVYLLDSMMAILVLTTIGWHTLLIQRFITSVSKLLRYTKCIFPISLLTCCMLYTILESWGSLEKNVGENLEGIGRYGWGDKTVQEANKEGANISIY